MAKEKKSFFESPIMKTRIKSSTVSLFPEAALGYLLGPVLALLCNGVLNVWLIQYWDKVLGLGTWAPLFETLMPIISAIVIVVGNLLVGKLMDRKPTLAGKARPLILLGMPVIAAALLLMFLVPFPEAGESNIATLAMVAVGYNLFYAIAWPIYYTSHSALVNLSTRDSGKRGLLSTCIMAAQLGASGLAGMAGGILVDLIGLLPVYSYIDLATGNEIKTNAIADLPQELQVSGLYNTVITPEEANQKWIILMIIMVAALIVGCLLEYYFSRERITEDAVKLEESAGAQKEVKKVSMGEQMKICIKDKYWWIIILFFFLYQFGGQMKNNAMSFYSQSMTGQNALSSLINTVGAVPTAAGMAIVWPIAAKIGKKKTIVYGGFLALLGAALSFIALVPGMSGAGIDAIAVGAFIVKALGTAPAMYIALSVMALVLDHQEAVYGVRTDGFTMAVYGSIMVAMAGICNGIIVGFNSAFANASIESKRFLNTFLAYGVEGIAYLIMSVLFFGMNVEKFTKVDNLAIVADQRANVLAEGGTWIEPEERARLEEEENDKLLVEQTLEQLKIDCAKKNLNFEDESKKFLDAHNAQLEAAKAKKADELAKAKAKEDALSPEVKAKRAASEEAALEELNEARALCGRPLINL